MTRPGRSMLRTRAPRWARARYGLALPLAATLALLVLAALVARFPELLAP